MARRERTRGGSGDHDAVIAEASAAARVVGAVWSVAGLVVPAAQGSRPTVRHPREVPVPVPVPAGRPSRPVGP
jgi:hypothetical protein